MPGPLAQKYLKTPGPLLQAVRKLIAHGELI